MFSPRVSATAVHEDPIPMMISLSASLELGPETDPAARARSRSRRRLPSADEVGSFILEQDDAARVQSAIEVTLQHDMRARLGNSLRETCADLECNYPEESKKGIHKARERASSELSNFVRSREATPSLGPRHGASPSLSISLPPAVPSAFGYEQLPAAAIATSPMFGSSSPSHVPLDGVSPTLEKSQLPTTMESPTAIPALPPAALECENLQMTELVASMYSHDGLLDHEDLLRAIYASQGLDFNAVQGQAHKFLQEIGLRPHDMGVRNVDEQGNTLSNQCFYLSLARGYLGHEAPWSDTSELALRLKRAIEAAVLAERPGTITGNGPGSEAMAFADFLPVAMKASSSRGGMDALCELAVGILDSTAGHVEVYLGSKYNDLQDPVAKENNLILLWFTASHYQCLVNDDEFGSKVRMTYDTFKDLLTQQGVQYIETYE